MGLKFLLFRCQKSRLGSQIRKHLVGCRMLMHCNIYNLIVELTGFEAPAIYFFMLSFVINLTVLLIAFTIIISILSFYIHPMTCRYRMN